MREKTLHVLEYDKIIEMLKDRASSEMTKKVISELEPVCDARLIKEKQQETTEAVKLISAKGPLAVISFTASVVSSCFSFMRRASQTG